MDFYYASNPKVVFLLSLSILTKYNLFVDSIFISTLIDFHPYLRFPKHSPIYLLHSLLLLLKRKVNLSSLYFNLV